MSNDLRVALIGYGLGGRAFHAPLIAATRGLRLATIVTSNPERQADAVRTFPNAHIADSAEWVWANARDHDLVVITTPNRFHVPLARASIAAGIAVVVDKPMAATAKEARDLIAEASQRNVGITAYHNRRWDGELLTAQKLIASGELGAVHRLRIPAGSLAPRQTAYRLARRRRARRRRRHSLRPRPASHRSGALAVRAYLTRVRRAEPPPSRCSGGRRCSSRSPSRRRARSLVGEFRRRSVRPSPAQCSVPRPRTPSNTPMCRRPPCAPANPPATRSSART